jgi:hypothetical protein
MVSIPEIANPAAHACRVSHSIVVGGPLSVFRPDGALEREI